MTEEKNIPSLETLARRVAALEVQVSKLDRLVYKLFAQRKRMPVPRNAEVAADR